ncbi:reverse transcriptase [Penicillium sp. DV-2018c]|nr:reverse transcriptase [Penicillium sp. DV-2018c]
MYMLRCSNTAQYGKTQCSTFGNIPKLVQDDALVESAEDKAKLLIDTFFPPTPPVNMTQPITTEESILMEQITDEEISTMVMKAKPWKAPGHDNLPFGIWQAIWPAVKTPVCRVFHASLKLGYVPRRWKITKIIPLRNPEKDYTRPNSYRPISLLPSLGKILEGVVAQKDLPATTHEPLWSEEEKIM